MDLLELEAMFIRARAARRFITDGEVSSARGLAMIVAPNKQLLDASIATARAAGVSDETRAIAKVLENEPGGARDHHDGNMAGTKGFPSGRRRPRRPVLPVTAGLPTPPNSQQIVSLDELVARY